MFVLSSDILFLNDESDHNLVTNSFDKPPFDGYDANESFGDMLNDSSNHWYSIYVVNKAIEEGRALDIYVETKRKKDINTYNSCFELLADHPEMQ